MQGIKEAQQLADAASRVLRVKGVETSLAFYTWFGSSNANPQFVNKLLDQHYTTAYTHLAPPTIPLIISLGERTRYTVSKGNPEPGVNSLLYMCPPVSGLLSDICEEGDGARVITTHRRNKQRVGPTIVALCPEFFSNRISTNAKMIESYRRDIYMENYSRGFYLLHELQHMPKATEPDPPAIDVKDLNGDGDCYSIRCCALLQHHLKISNAQNFAFFALDVTAYPEVAKPGSSESSST
ncbi:hypothetical protein LX32DRAFT_720965 [Colletotrichum zoysiae]|uniref:Uncharacterized protein n=1 Tax=Colletotrichum zoysiae TaxID=1216348 RepID=A0AAD9HFF7_9PEZI|nr:hypothetical protein LX32DRAFT_720965 [Colletotrichum zoysiae]